MHTRKCRPTRTILPCEIETRVTRRERYPVRRLYRAQTEGEKIMCEEGVEGNEVGGEGVQSSGRKDCFHPSQHSKVGVN